ncbi:concanavalin A-like lectin/glucanase domain-containing protein [Xylariales sp. AK1849]|nr:concanavalin A-like lectin/glucanase domain-containing protein [Xylariales sp. AK1849]
MFSKTLITLCALATTSYASPQGYHLRPDGGSHGCGRPGHSGSATASVIPTSAQATSAAPTSSQAAPSETTSTIIETTLVSTSEVISASIETATAASSQVVSAPVEAASTTGTEVISTSILTSAAAAATTSGLATEELATETLCGAPNAYEILSGTPWIVYSMNYNFQSISGSCCTDYYSTTGSGDDQTVHWSSVWDIDASVSTNVVKGYSFIGLTQNLETTLDSISSIPSTYTWSISNTTAYKGNVVYDFMTSDTKGDSTSSNAQELMLWLQYVGGQVPIGWAAGPVATINGLFGKDGWELYQGTNTDTGITVSSLLVPEGDMFDGTFEGDIKDWLLALSKQGIYNTSTYVNVGNAGMEPYWGTVTFDNNLSLRINL